MNRQVNQLLGGAQLVFDAIEGVTNTVEHMHANIAGTPQRLLPGISPSENSHGLVAAAVYKSIRGVNAALRGAGRGGSRLFADGGESAPGDADTRTVAALNGVAGDHLEATGNPLAIAMTVLAEEGRPVPLERDAIAAAVPRASPHIVVLVHGLALSELSWRRGGTDLGRRLAGDTGATPLYLRYNTGRHISINGRELANVLEALFAGWPTPVESVSLVGHSMGGLVIRSACWYAQQQGALWPGRLRRIVCLGTPHHGAPLEKAGHLLDRAMLATPWTAPLALGRKRSAGIKDLRHGNLLDEDWLGRDPDASGADTRRPVPLLEGVDYYFIAASVGRDAGSLPGHLLGDLLVRLGSALGDHPDDLRRVGVKPAHCRVFHEQHHFDLLDDERVHRQVVDWFSGSGSGSGRTARPRRGARRGTRP